MENKNSSEKKISVANFNIVFMDDKNESPLLDYFDTILMPAFNSGITKVQGDNTFVFMDVEIKQTNNYEYVLTGLIVKSTVLEIKSMFDENGKLVEKDEKYPTAPFSTFIIYLKNHRMVLIENQKGSPNLSSFRSMAKHVLEKYVSEQNILRIENKEKKLPLPIVSIVGIPPKGGMVSALKSVEKIYTLTLKFYPLNGDGDLDLSGSMSGVSNELRRKIGSERGSVVYRSPQKINGVIEVVEASEGTVEPIVVAKYPGRKGEATIKYTEISDRRRVNIPDGDKDVALESMIMQGKQIDSIQYESEDNNKIYEKNKGKIISFVQRKQ